MSRNTRIVLAAVSAIVTAGGCVDASGNFDEFARRVTDASPLADRSGNFADITGEHLLAVTPIVAPSTQLRVIATVSNFQDDGSGGATADFTFQPLTVQGGNEVGGELEASDVMIDSGGTFEVDVVGMVPGAANPISGQNIAADIQLLSSIVSADFWCGDVTGTANAGTPVDLAGSTFAATRVDPGTRGMDLPAVLGACDAPAPDAGP